MKRFILTTDQTADEQDKAFYLMLRSRFPNLGWWHHLGETWRFLDPTDSVTVSDIRDLATRAFPNVPLIPLEVEGNRWAGFGQASDFEWVNYQWEPER